MRQKLYFLMVGVIFFYSASCLGQTAFGPQQIVTDSSYFMDNPTSPFIADVDGDGQMDIIVAGTDNNKIVYYKNDGTGNFNSPNTISFDVLQPRSIFAADLDNDGDADVISASGGDHKVAFYENDGDGNFGPQQIVTTNAKGAFFVLAADVDGDNHLDIVSSSLSDSKIAYYKNDGNGNFGLEQVIDTNAFNLNSLYAADLDNDDDIDIIAGGFSSNKISLYRNDGNGIYSIEEITTTNAGISRSVFAADLDGDNDLEVLAVAQSGNKIIYFENDDGNFTTQKNIVSFISRPHSVYAADINNDGKVDVLSASYQNASINYHMNNGDGSFGYRSISNKAYGANSVLAADLNGNGNLDVISASVIDNKVASYLNDGMGNFSDQNLINPFANGARSVFAADIDGDGHSDLLSASLLDNKIAYYPNDGNGKFATQKIISALFDGGDLVRAADFDNDGDVDVIAGWFIQDRITYYENLGSGVFGEAQYPNGNSDGVRYLHTADVNHDGYLDLLSNSDEGVNLYLNDTMGGFETAQVVYANLDGVSGISTADIDNDGDLDIIHSSSVEDQIAYYVNDGNGNFTTQQIVSSTINDPRDVQVADVDNDGNIDILYFSFSDNKIAFFKNEGNGSFSNEIIIAINFDQPNSLHISDLDDDGDLDVMASSNADNEVAYFENDGTGVFGNKIVLTRQVLGTISVVASDLDGDGDNDIASASFGDDKVAYYENLLGEELTTVSGRIFWDKDENAAYNNVDEPFSGITIRMEPDGGTFYTDSEGEFIVFTGDTGRHQLIIVPPTRLDCEGIIDFTQSEPISSPFEFEYSDFLLIDQDFVFVNQNSNCKTVSGMVFNDGNQNGMNDQNEGGLNGILITTEDFGSTFSANEGGYSLSIPTNESSDLSIDLNNSVTNGFCTENSVLRFQTFPANNVSYPISAGQNNIGDLDFGVYTNIQESDFDVGIYTLYVFDGNQAGKTFHAWMDFKAFGEISETCSLRITHDPLINFLESSIPPSTITSTYVEWEFSAGNAPDLYCMQMDWFLDSSAVEGEVLHWEATYDCPPAIDACLENNLIIRDVPVVSGPLRLRNENAQLYSMRSKGEMPEMISNEEVLSYIISFQNPLEITAYNVTIIDTLPEVIDLSTISQPFSSFPNYDISISNDGVLVVQMDGINLSDIEEDELNSYGFIQLNAKLKNNLASGTAIPNKASVLFNGIESVTTNEVIHRIDSNVTSINDLSKNISVSVYPNPFHEYTIIQFNDALDFKYDLKLIDVVGKEVMQVEKSTEEVVKIEKGELPSGLYFLNIYSSEKNELLISYKLMIQ